jgi:hypothetical protein
VFGSIAGLVPYGDWVIGWAGGVLNHENDFYDVVEAVGRVSLAPRSIRPLSRPDVLFGLVFFQHIDRPLRIYVYSHDFESVPCSHLVKPGRVR